MAKKVRKKLFSIEIYFLILPCIFEYSVIIDEKLPFCYHQNSFKSWISFPIFSKSQNNLKKIWFLVEIYSFFQFFQFHELLIKKCHFLGEDAIFTLEAFFFRILRKILDKNNHVSTRTSKMAPYRHNSLDYRLIMKIHNQCILPAITFFHALFQRQLQIKLKGL